MKITKKYKRITLDGECNFTLVKGGGTAITIGRNISNKYDFTIKHFICHGFKNNFEDKWRVTKAALRYIWRNK